MKVLKYVLSSPDTISRTVEDLDHFTVYIRFQNLDTHKYSFNFIEKGYSHQ